jgi:hypothetical protein
MSAIRSVINALRGKGSLGNISDLALPNLPNPEIVIIADKVFA